MSVIADTHVRVSTHTHLHARSAERPQKRQHSSSNKHSRPQTLVSDITLQQKEWDSLREMVGSSAAQRSYESSLEYLVVPESQEMLKWVRGKGQRSQPGGAPSGQGWDNSSNKRIQYWDYNPKHKIHIMAHRDKNKY